MAFNEQDVSAAELQRMVNSIARLFLKDHHGHHLEHSDVHQQAYMLMMEERSKFDPKKVTTEITQDVYLNWLGWRTKMRLRDWNRQLKVDFRRSEGDIISLEIESLDRVVTNPSGKQPQTLLDTLGKEDMGYWFTSEKLSLPVIEKNKKDLAGRSLTVRQTEILALLANGNTFGEAAEMLSIGVETVKSHKKIINLKLKARNGSHAIAIGIRQGII